MTNAARQHKSKSSFRTLIIVTPRAASLTGPTGRALPHVGQNVVAGHPSGRAAAAGCAALDPLLGASLWVFSDIASGASITTPPILPLQANGAVLLQIQTLGWRMMAAATGAGLRA
jgi:hypothetical protein